jgi:NodT family efflux transporter outer membrane factor (OMF) lipoprotein
VGPDYATPEVPLPRSWVGVLGEGGTGPADAALARWWTGFQDPALDALVAEALDANLDLAAARARVTQARTLLVMAGAAGDLQVSAPAGAERGRPSENAFGGGTGTAFAPPGQTTDFFVLGFDAAWELDLYGRTRREVEAAEADLQAVAAESRAVQVTLLAEVADSYLELRGAERRLAIAEDNVRAWTDTLALVSARRDGGLATELDVVRARAQLEDGRAAVPAQVAERGLAGHRLDVLLARPPGTTLAALPPPPGHPVLPALPIGLPTELLTRRPDIVRAERRLAAATARIGVAVADRFPRLDLAASLGLASSSTASLFERSSRAWSLGLGVDVPVMDGGRRSANVERAQAVADESLAAYRLAVLGALRETEDALLTHAGESERREALVRAEAEHRLATTLAGDLYGSGMTDFLDVLAAERDLHTAEDALAVSERELGRELVALYKALGGGWDDVGVPQASGPPSAGAP